MSDILLWKSNNQRVADREVATCRVRNGQLEIVPDPKTGVYVPVYLKSDAQTNVPPASVSHTVTIVSGEPPT